jgi:hypothetical protein
MEQIVSPSGVSKLYGVMGCIEVLSPPPMQWETCLSTDSDSGVTAAVETDGEGRGLGGRLAPDGDDGAKG